MSPAPAEARVAMRLIGVCPSPSTSPPRRAAVSPWRIEAFKRAGYFIAQGHWLLSRFPNGLYEDVPGLCKVVTRQEIAANDWSLTPGRYVGVAVGQQDEDDGEAFTKRMREIHIELAELNDKAVELAGRIASNFEELLQ